MTTDQPNDTDPSDPDAPTDDHQTDALVRHPEAIRAKIAELRAYDDYGTGPRADNKRYKHQGWLDALRWVMGSDLGVEP